MTLALVFPPKLTYLYYSTAVVRPFRKVPECKKLIQQDCTKAEAGGGSCNDKKFFQAVLLLLAFCIHKLFLLQTYYLILLLYFAENYTFACRRRCRLCFLNEKNFCFLLNE